MEAEGARVRIEELRLVGYRAFDNARLALDDLTVLVGRNGAGKSTIIDAFEFLREALTDSLENALERRGGIQALVHKGPKSGKRLTIAVKLRVRGDPFGSDFADPVEHSFLYGFTLGGSKAKGVLVKAEYLACRHESRLHSGYLEHLESEQPSLKLPLVGPFQPENRLLLNALSKGLLTYKLHPATIRTVPVIGREVPLNRDGSNAGDVLQRLEKHPDEVTWIVKHLGAITPGIVGIKAGTAGDTGRRIVRFLQSAGGTKPTPFEIGAMSDGTLRSLAILLALRQRPTPALVCIDEIEDSVHPSALAVLLDAVSASTERCQVLLTSHSPEALSHEAVTARRVRVVDWDAGRSHVFRLSEGAEEISRPPGSVGELLRTNALFTEGAPERVEGDPFGGG
jgi:predicted ATPase